jgi:hypothetical protein
MRSGDRPGLQNRRVAGNPVTGGFDPHSLPPVFFNSLHCICVHARFSGGQMQICLGISVADVLNQAAQKAFILGQFPARGILANQIT